MKHSQPRPSLSKSRTHPHGKSRRFDTKSSGFTSEKRAHVVKHKANYDEAPNERYRAPASEQSRRYDKKSTHVPDKKRFYTAKPKVHSKASDEEDSSGQSFRSDFRNNRRSSASSERSGHEFFEKKKSQGVKPRNIGPIGKKRFSDNKKSFRPDFRSQRSAELSSADKPLQGRDVLWGLHAVRAAWLNTKRQCFRLWLTESGQKAFAATLTEAELGSLERPIFKMAERSILDQLTPPGSVHQGIVLEAAPLAEPSLYDVALGDNPADVLLMLDQVTDPHNVGAILRSAAALGASAVIMTERNAPNTTGVLAKSASGAVEHVPQIHVVNLARTLDDLQQAGYWCVGLAEEGEKDLSELDLSSRVVIVLGAEGSGLRQLTRKKCNELARLPTSGVIGSLNVSNAAAVALYETRRQKSKFQK